MRINRELIQSARDRVARLRLNVENDPDGIEGIYSIRDKVAYRCTQRERKRDRERTSEGNG